MDLDEFKEQLLKIMEAKHHFAWPAFTSGQVRRDRLHLHLEQEYATYVRDFPVLVARAYVRCPIASVRRELIENVYEEETGGLAAGRPHPELFLELPRGLGMDLRRFENVQLLAEAAEYRRYLDSVTQTEWDLGAAVTTLFVEGTRYERGELEPEAPKRPEPPLTEHPLVKHYQLPREALALTRAHRSVEGQHRAAAWRTVLGAVTAERRLAVVDAMRGALLAWLRYRDGVAAVCGVQRPIACDGPNS